MCGGVPVWLWVTWIIQCAFMYECKLALSCLSCLRCYVEVVILLSLFASNFLTSLCLQ